MGNESLVKMTFRSCFVRHRERERKEEREADREKNWLCIIGNRAASDRIVAGWAAIVCLFVWYVKGERRRKEGRKEGWTDRKTDSVDAVQFHASFFCAAVGA